MALPKETYFIGHETFLIPLSQEIFHLFLAVKHNF